MAANDNDAGIKYLDDGGASGTVLGKATTDKIGFFAATPVAQQTSGTTAPAVDPGANTSALVASIQSIAVAAASLANANKTTLDNLGLQA